MSCPDCTSGPVSTFSQSYFGVTNPNGCSTACGQTTNSQCVYYAGPNLSCSGVHTLDSVEVALQKLDQQICTVQGNYASYNVHCLPGPITTEAQFVSAVTLYACNTQTALTNFTGTTFPFFQTLVNSRLLNVEQPQLTCTSAGITSTNDRGQVLAKYCTKFSQIDQALDLSSVNWSACFTPSSLPTGLASAFSLINDQICQLKAGAASASLPTFNNASSCLSTTGTADSLVSTVEAIKTRLCTTPSFNINTLSWTCVSKPSSTATDLQGAFQALMNKVNTLAQNQPTFSGDFTVTATNGADACAGKTIALATPINQDRLVAATSSDTSPGTLINKLQAGSGVTLDSATTPGKIIINTAGTTDDRKVKASAGDDAPDFLDQKMLGIAGAFGLGISTAYNGTSKKVTVQPTLSPTTFINALFDAIDEDPDLKARFCALVASCPSPCTPPTNVQAVAITGSSTTTTTTTLP